MIWWPDGQVPSLMKLSLFSWLQYHQFLTRRVLLQTGTLFEGTKSPQSPPRYHKELSGESNNSSYYSWTCRITHWSCTFLSHKIRELLELGKNLCKVQMSEIGHTSTAGSFCRAGPGIWASDPWGSQCGKFHHLKRFLTSNAHQNCVTKAWNQA